jgi:hypothetical protein
LSIHKPRYFSEERRRGWWKGRAYYASIIYQYWTSPLSHSLHYFLIEEKVTAENDVVGTSTSADSQHSVFRQLNWFFDIWKTGLARNLMFGNSNRDILDISA